METGRGTVADPDAWLATYWPLLVHAARGILRGVDEAPEAEDAAQDAAVKIWRHWSDGSYDPARGTRLRWAYTIAVNQAIDRRRRLSRRRRAEAAAETAWPAPDGSGWDPERRATERDLLAGAWRRLSPQERRAAALLATGHTLAGTAARLEQPLGTLKSHVRRMRLRLASEVPSESAA